MDGGYKNLFINNGLFYMIQSQVGDSRNFWLPRYTFTTLPNADSDADCP